MSNLPTTAIKPASVLKFEHVFSAIPTGLLSSTSESPVVSKENSFLAITPTASSHMIRGYGVAGATAARAQPVLLPIDGRNGRKSQHRSGEC